MTNHAKAWVVSLCTTLFFGVGMAWAGSGSAGDCGPPNVEVRGKIYLRNNTGQPATDCHFYMYQNDRPSVHVTGAKASSSSFGTVGVGLGTDNGQGGTPPPGNHGAQVDMTGGTVPAGSTIAIDISLCMNEQNCVKIKDIEWTFTGPGGSGDPPEPARRKNGFRISRPSPGGPGGKPASQEGNGGAGRYVHRVCIENDSTTDPLPLKWVKVFASMTTYPDLEDINWAAVPDVQDAANRPPVSIPPGGSWCIDFPTTGSYVGGHIYIKYAVNALGNNNLNFAPAPQQVQDDPDDITVGDHPVESEIEYDLTLGDDYWMTDDITSITCGGDVPTIPADFFGPGSDPFLGTIQLEGLPLNPSTLGPTDTIVRRLGIAELGDIGQPATIPIELVALSLQSVQPIEIPTFVSNGLSWQDVLQPFTDSSGLNPIVVGVSNNGVSIDTEVVQMGLTAPSYPILLTAMSAADTGGPPGQWGITSFFDVFFTLQPALPPLPVSGLFDVVVDIRDPGLVNNLSMTAEPYVVDHGTYAEVIWYTTVGGFKERHVLTIQPTDGQPVSLNFVDIQGLNPGLSIFRILVYVMINDPVSFNQFVPAFEADLITEQLFPLGSSFFDVFYSLDDTAPSGGTMDVVRDDPSGGTFSMTMTYTPLVSFEPVGGGPILTLPDVDPRTVGSLLDTGYRYAPAPPVAYPNAGPNFWPLPAVSHLLSMPGGNPHSIVPSQSSGPPTPVFAESVKQHGAGGPFGVDLLNPSGSLPRSVEPRQNSVTQIVVTFNKPIFGAGGLDPGDVTLSSGSVGLISIVGDYQLVLNTTGILPSSYTRISFPGIVDAQNQAVLPGSSICFAARAGDTNGDGNVNIFDLVTIRNLLNQATTIGNFRADLNHDNAVNIFDLVVCRNNLGQNVVGACPP